MGDGLLASSKFARDPEGDPGSIPIALHKYGLNDCANLLQFEACHETSDQDLTMTTQNDHKSNQARFMLAQNSVQGSQTVWLTSRCYLSMVCNFEAAYVFFDLTANLSQENRTLNNETSTPAGTL